MKKTTIIAVIMGVLVLITLFQAIQLGSMKTNIANEGLSMNPSTTKAASTPTLSSEPAKRTSSLPSSIEKLPQMVGGC